MLKLRTLFILISIPLLSLAAQSPNITIITTPDSLVISPNDLPPFFKLKATHKQPATTIQTENLIATPLPIPDLPSRKPIQKPQYTSTPENRTVTPYTNTLTADTPFRKTATNILLVGSGKTLRAIEPFGGNPAGGAAYANAANTYQRTFKNKVQVYCTAIPNASAFYTPTAAKQYTRDVGSAINKIFAALSDSVIAVDIFTPLSQHADEPIYSRTDHHWAPLGAYYAAQRFADLAGVPFPELNDSTYTTHVIRNYVGSMYSFAKDVAVKNAPEDFIYYVPRNVEYTTTYINYSLDKSRKNIIGESKPFEGQFFFSYKDGSGAAYCTFMGGDSKIVKVQTSTKNNRRLIILKDSYGNAIPGFLFYSFEEIHVIDCRFFNRNMIKYVNDNQITDILFANNAVHASVPKISASYLRFLNQ